MAERRPRKKTTSKATTKKRPASTRKHSVARRRQPNAPSTAVPVTVTLPTPPAAKQSMTPVTTPAVVASRRPLLWFSVAGVMLVIMILWVWSWRFTMLQPDALTDLTTNSDISHLYADLQTDWAGLQNTAADFERQISDDALGNSSTTSPTTPPENLQQELDNLFSDVR
ncbi:MAG: hypothetical protein HYV33_02720 [Candidatus Kerfeldbacteria bacterium]|nr:hypothetical protein [Candidatus Kerfeldbacteria bacterium]